MLRRVIEGFEIVTGGGNVAASASLDFASRFLNATLFEDLKEMRPGVSRLIGATLLVPEPHVPQAQIFYNKVFPRTPVASWIASSPQPHPEALWLPRVTGSEEVLRNAFRSELLQDGFDAPGDASGRIAVYAETNWVKAGASVPFIAVVDEAEETGLECIERESIAVGGVILSYFLHFDPKCGRRLTSVLMDAMGWKVSQSSLSGRGEAERVTLFGDIAHGKELIGVVAAREIILPDWDNTWPHDLAVPFLKCLDHADLDARTKHAQELGARLLSPVTEADGHAFSVIQDPFQGVLGLCIRTDDL